MASLKVFHKMHLAHRAIFRAADHVLQRTYDVTAAQNGLLMFLEKNEGATMGAVAEALGLKNAAVSGLVDRMAKKGLIERQESLTDRRSFVLALKEPGREIVSASRQMIKATNQQLLDGFTPAEQAVIDRFLDSITETAEKIERSGFADEAGHDLGKKEATHDR